MMEPSATALQIERKVVVDAGAAIRLQRIETFGNEFFTTEEVYNEIRDAQARRHLQTLPFELQIKQPFKEDFMTVKQFAKQTGDLGSLSTNDMGLMALAVRLHRENGGDDLRKEPCMAEISKKRVPFSWAPKTGNYRHQDRKLTELSSIVDTESALTGTLDEERSEDFNADKKIDNACAFFGGSGAAAGEHDEDVLDDDDEDNINSATERPEDYFQTQHHLTSIDEEESSAARPATTCTKEQENDGAAGAMNDESEFPSLAAAAAMPADDSSSDDDDDDGFGEHSKMPKVIHEDGDLPRFEGDKDDEIIEQPSTDAVEDKAEETSSVLSAKDGEEEKPKSNSEPERPLTWAEKAALASKKEAEIVKVQPKALHDRLPPLTQTIEGYDEDPYAPVSRTLYPGEKRRVPGTDILLDMTPENRKDEVGAEPETAHKMNGPTNESGRLLDLEKQFAEEADTAAEDGETKNPAEAKSRILSGAGATGVQVDIVSDESDDDEGWVTVENIKRLNNVVDNRGKKGRGKKGKGASPFDEADPENTNKVAILSTDYSVQNVSIQMGLQAISCDGYRIRSVKMWGKICRACFHSTRDTTKIFCEKCGNPTLDRVPITLDAEGNMVLHDNRRRKPNLRGTIYSIPKQQHGRKAKNLILREDEMSMGGRDRQMKYEQKLAEKQRHIRDNSESLDAWCSRHVTSTGKVVSQNPHQMKHGYGRRNPNANNFKNQRFKR